MTNESKAIEIYNRETDKGFHLGTHSLVEMAEWKGQQFKEYLEALRELIEEECEIVTVPSYNGTPIEEEVVSYKKLLDFLDNYGKEE